MPDPRSRAQEKFSGPPQWSGHDLLARCATDPPLAIQTLVDAVRVSGSGRICEMGFGSGWLIQEMLQNLPEAELYAFDQSASYVLNARSVLPARVHVIRGDMEELPFAHAAFDVIVTCWTLYFMQDIDAALAGMKRCLRPGGRLVAATVAPDHMIEHEDMATDAVRAAGYEREPDMSMRFDLETGEPYMRRHFRHVELRPWSGELALPDIESAMELWDAYTPDGLSSEVEPLARVEYERLAAERLRRDGTIRVRRHDGAFVASD